MIQKRLNKNKKLLILLSFIIAGTSIYFVKIKVDRIEECRFENNVTVTQKKYDYASVINNQYELELVKKHSIVDIDLAKIGDYIMKTKDFYYRLNDKDLGQYEIKKLQNITIKSENDVFTKDVLIKRKPVLMYRIPNNIIGNYMQKKCKNVFSYNKGKDFDFISYNNKDYINLIDGQYVIEKYYVKNLEGWYFKAIVIIDSLISLVFG